MAPGYNRLHLLGLPPEIRNNIYGYILDPSASRKPHLSNPSYTTYDYRRALQLLYVNKQVYTEARAVFQSLNTFVLVETPWAEALNHVANEGRVPIVASGYPGWNFDLWSLKVEINAPQWRDYEDQHLSFAIHLDDLPAFTNKWRYSDLSEPMLNSQLGVTFALRDASRRAEWDEPRVSKALQQRLLMPFTIVKKLHSINFEGEPKPLPSVVDALKKGMSEPHESPESCLRKATSFKEAGNTALKAGRYEEALEMYNRAWLAMHIVIHGRERQIHADAHFNRELWEEPFKGMQGHAVRLALRVKLVANTVMLFLKMKEYDVSIVTT